MSTLVATSASPPRTLVVSRWSAFFAALVTGVLASVLNRDLIRDTALGQGITDAAELDLTVTFASWFGAVANVITVVGVSLLVGVVAALALRSVASGRRAVVRHTLQLAASLALLGVFVLGLLR
ncbi:hypothetical protein BJF80_05895 [Serinicoccus sp. CUA-874]|uniref:hypothetical protein n=1 Tax=Serinicoccus sp. CUA-874 TaxID=1517939 RepID=UPI00096281DD|nr:hypothetical protein [Serinicoccus sp. CUA-874]OLT16831.1 hypothetical protein BJF80_05895 [Serinicoccus sp. CUA-874]